MTKSKRIAAILLTGILLSGCSEETTPTKTATDEKTAVAADISETEITTKADREKASEENSKFDSTKGPEPSSTPPPFFEIESITDPFEFPANYLAAFTDGEYYSSNYAIVEPQKLTVCTGGEITKYDFSDCVAGYSRIERQRIINSDEENIGEFVNNHYSFNGDIIISESSIRIGDLLLDNKTDVINNMPTVYYESLDSQGEFGAMKVPDEIKSVIKSEAGEDYILYNNPNFNNYNIYLLSCFEDEILSKQVKFMVDESGCIREDIIFHSSYGVYDNNIGNYCYIPSKWGAITSLDTYRCEENVIGGSCALSSIVYGEHCFENKLKEGAYFWLSKPISIEEGKKLNELNPLIANIYDFTNVQFNELEKKTYPQVTTLIWGDNMGEITPTALASQTVCSIKISDTKEYTLTTGGTPCSNITHISSKDNTLIICTDKVVKRINNRWNLISGFSVVEATVNGDKLTVTFKYYSDENVNSENYNSYTPDETVTSEYSK